MPRPRLCSDGERVAFRLEMISSSSFSVRAGYGMWKCSVGEWTSYRAPVKVWSGSCAAGDNSLSGSVDKEGERKREREKVTVTPKLVLHIYNWFAWTTYGCHNWSPLVWGDRD